MGRRQAWNRFRTKLEKVDDYMSAMALHHEACPVDAPGRSFYSNLGFFMHSFWPPNGASRFELEQYLRILREMQSRGQLKEGDFPELEQKMLIAIESRHRYLP